MGVNQLLYGHQVVYKIVCTIWNKSDENCSIWNMRSICGHGKAALNRTCEPHLLFYLEHFTGKLFYLEHYINKTIPGMDGVYIVEGEKIPGSYLLPLRKVPGEREDCDGKRRNLSWIVHCTLCGSEAQVEIRYPPHTQKSCGCLHQAKYRAIHQAREAAILALQLAQKRMDVKWT